MEENDQIVIVVSHPEQRSQIGGVNKYHVYTVRGKDTKGQIDIVRRYSDFNLLREILVKRWPGFYVPSLPEKKTIGSNELLFLQNRRKGLEQFLRTLSENIKLWRSEEMDIFLRYNSGDSQKLLNPLLKQSSAKILGRYKQLFPQYQKLELKSDQLEKINSFNSYLKDSKIILQQLTEQTEKMYEMFRRSLEKKLIFVQFLLPDYQKNCLLANDERKKAQNLLFLASSTNGIGQSLQKFKKLNQYPPILFVTEQIKREGKQIEVFENLLKIRQEYESMKNKSLSKVKDIQIETNKINAGKQSILSKIKNVSKEQQLATNQRQLEKAKLQEDNYIILCQIVNNVIAKNQIDRFKQQRQKAYFKMLKNFAKAEQQLAEGEKNIWVQVGHHDLINIQQENKLLIKKNLSEQYQPKMDVITQEETNEIENEQEEIKDEQNL